MKPNQQASKKTASFGNPDRDKRIKKVGKMEYSKPKHRHSLLITED